MLAPVGCRRIVAPGLTALRHPLEDAHAACQECRPGAASGGAGPATEGPRGTGTGRCARAAPRDRRTPAWIDRDAASGAGPRVVGQSLAFDPGNASSLPARSCLGNVLGPGTTPRAESDNHG